MRGIPSLVTDIRKSVFTEVARMAYDGGDYSKAEEIPYIIVPGDQPLHRESIFLERAIAGERVRLAMGLSPRSAQKRMLMTEGMDQAAIAEQYYEPPLINIIPYSMIEKLYPTEMKKISMTLTPMVFTARLMKKQNPGCKVVFVGPCAAKKLEAIREDIRSDVDFVLTFEELMGMFQAKNIDFTTIEERAGLNEGSAAGRGFAVAGGVAKAVADLAEKEHNDLEIKTARAEGLRDCRKLMAMAKAGRYKGYLLEGMACPGGCVAGAGTIINVEQAKKNVSQYVGDAQVQSPLNSPYRDVAEKLD